MKSILERIKRLESAIKQRIESLIVGNDDGFLDALVGADHVEQYRDSNGGFDFMAALGCTARDDWRGYSAPDESEESQDES